MNSQMMSDCTSSLECHENVIDGYHFINNILFLMSKTHPYLSLSARSVFILHSFRKSYIYLSNTSYG